jgi:hypothetical protein
MREELIEQFWDDYYECQGERHPDIALRKLLIRFRGTLEDGSKTAFAIDYHYSLNEIICRAKDENHFEFAQTVLYAKYHLV